MKQQAIAVDFDRVIHDIDHPIPDRKMGAPLAGCSAVLIMLYEKDIAVDVFTVRAATERGRRVVEDWMRYYNLPYRFITAAKQSDWLVIVDDIGHHFTGWGAGMEDVYQRLHLGWIGPDEITQAIEDSDLSSVQQQQKPNKSMLTYEEADAMLEGDTRLIGRDKKALAVCSFCGGQGSTQVSAMGTRTKCKVCGGTGKVPAA